MIRTTEDFIKRAKQLHGDKYSYEKTVYVNTKTKVTITCPVHGDFSMMPTNHYSRSGCPKCSGKGYKYSQEEINLIQSEIESYVAYNVNPDDKLIQNALGFDSGTDSDWTGEDVVVVDDEEDDGSTAEVEDDGSTAEVEDDGNTATIDDEDEKIYREVEACNFGKNSKGKRRVVVLPPAMDIRFYQDILKRLGTNVTCEKMLFFFAWRDGESSESTYNPFATTYKEFALALNKESNSIVSSY